MNALLEQGVEVKAEAKVTIGPDGINGDLTSGLCAYSPGSKSSLVGPLALFGMAAAWLARSRKRSARKPS